jgi:hypothetical protein
MCSMASTKAVAAAAVAAVAVGQDSQDLAALEEAGQAVEEAVVSTVAAGVAAAAAAAAAVLPTEGAEVVVDLQPIKAEAAVAFAVVVVVVVAVAGSTKAGAKEVVGSPASVAEEEAEGLPSSRAAVGTDSHASRLRVATRDSHQRGRATVVAAAGEGSIKAKASKAPKASPNKVAGATALGGLRTASVETGGLPPRLARIGFSSTSRTSN